MITKKRKIKSKVISSRVKEKSNKGKIDIYCRLIYDQTIIFFIQQGIIPEIVILRLVNR